MPKLSKPALMSNLNLVGFCYLCNRALDRVALEVKRDEGTVTIESYYLPCPCQDKGGDAMQDGMDSAQAPYDNNPQPVLQ